MVIPFVLRRELDSIRADLDLIRDELDREVEAHEATRNARDQARAELETERTRRLGAEALAGARAQEIDRLVSQCAALQSALSERVKSLDSLVVRLSEPRAPEPAPDLDQYRKAREEVVAQGLRGIRQMHSTLDQQLIQKLYPNLVRHSLNAPSAPSGASPGAPSSEVA